MFTKISRLLSVLLIGGMLLGSVAFPINARADSIITVTTTEDELNTDGDCSLREAIQAANTNTAVDACVAGSGADTITVPAGTYTLTIVGPSGDTNSTGDLDITESVTINGAGVGITIVQAGTDSTNGIHRVIEIISGISVNISDVTIANGKYTGGFLPKGGGIYNSGTLTVMNSSFSGNSATYGGGGIYNGGTLTVTNSTFSNNCTFEHGGGGGIMNNGFLTVTDNTFTGNCSKIFAGGISNFDGTLAVTNSTFSGNIAGKGGGIYNKYGSMTVTNSTFLGNKANSLNLGGGGIYNDGAASSGEGIAVVTNSTFSANIALNGGGIYNSFGTLTVTNSTFSDNTARSSDLGGGIANVYGTIKIYNSILANTTSDGFDCYNTNGTISGTTNLIEIDAGGVNACETTAPIHSDPNLGLLADNGGPTQTFALLSGSPAIDAGNDAICAAYPVSNNSQNGVARPQGVHCDIGSFEFPLASPYTYRSVGTNDGWILESTETSSKGGTMNSTGQAIAMGDDVTNKQYRSILHFDTASLPDNAVITKVTLMIKKKAVFGADPFTTHKFIKVDIRKNSFSNNPVLQLTDFQAAASRNWIGTIKNIPVNDWYSAVLNQLAFPFVNLTGATQFRLYFALDDDNDRIADYIQFFSGNATATDRPQLIIEYYVP